LDRPPDGRNRPKTDEQRVSLKARCAQIAVIPLGSWAIRKINWDRRDRLAGVEQRFRERHGLWDYGL
jgi:hypothetical protein